MKLKVTWSCIALGLAAAALMPAGTSLAQSTDPAPGAERPSAAANQHQHHGRRTKQIMLAGAEGADIVIWKPDLEQIPLEAEMGVITIPKTGVDNYHAIVAEKDWGDTKETIIRYEYLRGKPSKRSPSELTSARKSAFEIIPDPLPREHQDYQSAEAWAFLLRFNGVPVADRTVVLETMNGSRLESVSDADGRVAFTLPDDFPDMIEGERDRRSADFQLSADHLADGITYQTTLSSKYEVNMSHWRSAPLGAAVIGIGFIAGLFLGRRNLKNG